MVLGYLEKIQGDHALALHHPGTAAERYQAAQELWLTDCRTEPDMIEALGGLVLGYLNCNQTGAAVELLETTLEISLEAADYRRVFDYYGLLSDHKFRLDGATVRRLLARILHFYLLGDQPINRASFAYSTTKMLTDDEVADSLGTPFESQSNLSFTGNEALLAPSSEAAGADDDDSSAVPGPHVPQSVEHLRLALHRVLLALDFLPSNQFNDMALIFIDSHRERATAMLELSADEDDA